MKIRKGLLNFKLIFLLLSLLILQFFIFSKAQAFDFVIPHIPGIWAFAEPNDNSPKQMQLPILQAYQVVDEQNNYYKLKPTIEGGRPIGWVKKDFLLLWPYRHGLMPIQEDIVTKGYCDEGEIQKVADGSKVEPCTTIPRNLLDQIVKDKNVDIRPFPVLTVKKIISKYQSSVYFLKAAMPVSQAGYVITPEVEKLKYKFSQLDIVIVLDNTGSMEEEVLSVHNLLNDLITGFDKNYNNTYVNLITYTDEQVIATGLKPVNQVVNSIPSTAGGKEEWLLDALWLSTFTKWRAGSMKVVLVIGDEPFQRKDDNISDIPVTGGYGIDLSTNLTVQKGKTKDELIDKIKQSYRNNIFFWGIITINDEGTSTLLYNDLDSIIRSPSLNNVFTIKTIDKPFSKEELAGQKVIVMLQPVFDQITNDIKERLQKLEQSQSELANLSTDSNDRYYEILTDIWGKGMVIKEVWLRSDNIAFSNVLLLDRNEMRIVRDLLQNSKNILGAGQEASANHVWEQLWEKLIGRRESIKEFINDPLWNYWIGRIPEDSLLRLSPQQIAHMEGSTRIEKIGEIERAIAYLDRELNKNEQQFFWIPFRFLP